MSKSLAFSYSDTAFGSPETLNLVRANTNYGEDWTEKERKTGETIITNVNASNDRPEQIRIAYSRVNDIYKNSGIDPVHFAPSKRGFSLVTQITEVGRVTESTTGESYDVPFSLHLVMKASNDELVTPAVMETLLKRLLSSLYLDNEDGTERIAQLMKGAVTPPEV